MTAWMTLTTKRRQVAIAGQVIEAVTQQPIAGATIRVLQSPPEFQQILKLKRLQFGDRPIAQFDQAVSAIDGCFYFLNLPAGSYTLTASLPNTGTRYETVTAKASVSRNAEGNLERAIVEMVLPTTALSGTVTHEDKPVSMARIQVKGSNVSTFSNADGTYLLTGLEVSQLIVQVLANDYLPLSPGAQLEQGKVTKLDVQLKARSPKSSSPKSSSSNSS